jgi:hypothetical protein
MRYILSCLLIFVVFFSTQSQVNSVMTQDTVELPPHSIRAIATVKSADYDHMIIVIENVVAYSRGVTATPLQGDELTVRLPGRNKPEHDTRIEVDLKESIDVGALPSSYIVLAYRTID